MLKFLSSEYQLYACGKNLSHALTLNENHHFAKGSNNQKFGFPERPRWYLRRTENTTFQNKNNVYNSKRVAAAARLHPGE